MKCFRTHKSARLTTTNSNILTLRKAAREVLTFRASAEATAEDLAEAEPYLRRYAERFGADVEFLLRSSCTVVTPGGANPYRQMYVSN